MLFSKIYSNCAYRKCLDFPLVVAASWVYKYILERRHLQKPEEFVPSLMTNTSTNETVRIPKEHRKYQRTLEIQQ